MAVTLLKILYGILGVTVTVIRSRDPIELAKCDIVVDVGGGYDPSSRLFDHHQKDCNEKFDNGEVKLSSAGMVWKEFGKIFIDLHLTETFEKDEKQYIIDEAYLMIYEKIFKEIDAHDNGQDMIRPAFKRVDVLLYEINLSLGNTITKINFLKNVEGNDKFNMACDFTKTMLMIHVMEILDLFIQEIKELPVLRKLYENRPCKFLLDIPENVTHNSKLISKVDEEAKELLFYVSENTNEKTKIKTWGMNTMKVDPKKKSFEIRKKLLSTEELEKLKELKELNDEEFGKIKFIHKDLFTGSTTDHEVALKICRLSASKQ
jgi:uncharacterized UPF0160 family protein